MLEYLLEVVYHIVIGSRSVTHHEIDGMLFSNLGDGGLVHIAVKTSNEVVVIYHINVLARYLFRFYLGGQFYAESPRLCGRLLHFR